MQELEHHAEQCVACLDAAARSRLSAAGLVACVGTSDVHEYGKLLVEAVLRRLNVTVIDAGVSTDADALASTAEQARADFIALSTYNGIALDYLRALRSEMQCRTYSVPVYIGGKLNQIVPGDESNLPIDVSDELTSIGAIVCTRVEDMLRHLIHFVIE
jgi:methylmalonyl-CoA mutase cobalamin-binding subunit